VERGREKKKKRSEKGEAHVRAYSYRKIKEDKMKPESHKPSLIIIELFHSTK